MVWSGEFGRTHYAEGQDGRDHSTNEFTSWMAGGGIKPGITYGRSDDHGYDAIKLHFRRNALVGFGALAIMSRGL